MSTSTRWTVVVLAVVVALIGALWLQLQDDDAAPGGGTPAARDRRDADTAEALAG
ncbi:TlpA family protein disulfide reductase, partial [Mycolicibacterium sp. KC 300]|nr:TlpA family protein disulfide reductase [Mycolicibacterium arseniciresistens]